MYFLLKHNLNHLPAKQVIQKSRVTLKAGDTIKIRTNKEETWDNIGSVIVPNNCPGSYVLNVKGNLLIRNHCHLISTNKDFFVKRDYENITELSKVTSRKTVTPPRTDTFKYCCIIRTKGGYIIRNPQKVFRRMLNS